MPCFVFRSPQMFLDCCLGTDPCMIYTWQPKNFKALHSRATRKDVLDGVVEYVAERKHACDVWWRHHDREGRLRRVRICDEIAILHPALIPFRLNRLWIVSLREFCHRDQSSKAGAGLQMTESHWARDSASPLVKGLVARSAQSAHCRGLR